MSDSVQKGTPMHNALCELVKLKATIKGLEARAKKLQDNILKNPEAPQKFNVEGVGALSMGVKISYDVDKGIVVKQLGADRAIEAATISLTNLKKVATATEMAAIEKAGGVAKEHGAASYKFTAAKKN